MTQNREFKQLVRERMANTGERYTAARAHLIHSPNATTEPIKGLFPGYTRFGGLCRDTGALTNALAQAGVVSPHTHKPRLLYTNQPSESRRVLGDFFQEPRVVDSGM